MWLSTRRERERGPAAGQHVDRRVLRAAAGLLRPLPWWFQAEVRGLENIPEGPCVLVGNHSGGMCTPDTFVFGLAYYRSRGFEEPVFMLAHDMFFRLPGVATLMGKLGAAPAHPDVGHALLEAGHKVLAYPGGEWEVHRPSAERDRVDFAGHQGFLKLARRARVPLVPVVSAGGHDGWWVLTRGARLAKALRLDRLLRLKTFPIAVAAPTGLVVGPVSLHLPLPRPIVVEVLPPRPAPASLDEGYRAVTDEMQAALTKLASELRGRPTPARSPTASR